MSNTSCSMEDAVVPTEDVVQALLDYLVEPLLPARPTDHSPSLPDQESMAKQMHAVVLLYNYYHRKQFPLLEFLDFESFCKVSVNAKPSLLVYMNLMKKGSSESNELEKMLSLTERAIMSACNVCLALDASKDVPCIEGWPISKVVVFLTDSVKNNCSLQFGYKTKGVWSLMEKDIDSSLDIFEDKPITKDVKKKQKTTKIPIKDELRTNEASFKQLAFSAVKETTGIDHMDLLVLESHVVPSLDREKTAAYLYILQCTKLVNENIVPIGDAITSLQGPLVKKIFDNTASEVVEYFHLLPYAWILSNWFSRDGNGKEMTSSREDDLCKAKAKSHKVKCTPTPNMAAVDLDGKEMRSSTEDDLSNAEAESHKVNKADFMVEEHNNSLAVEKSAYGNDIAVSVDQVNRLISSLEDDPSNAKDGSEHKVKTANLMVEEPNNGMSAERSAYGNDITVVVDHANKMRRPTENDPSDPKSHEKVNKADLMIEEHKNGLEAEKSAYGNHITVDVDQVNRLISSLEDDPCQGKDGDEYKVNKGNMMVEETKNGLAAEKSVIGNDITVSMDHVNGTMRHTENHPSDAEAKAHEKLRNDDCVIEERNSGSLAGKSAYGDANCRTDMHGQVGMPSGDHLLVPFQPVAQKLDSTQTMLASKGNEMLEAALRLLYKKRGELSQQQRHLQDEVARCENNLQTVLSGGDDLMLKLHCVIEACNVALDTRCIPSHMETYQNLGEHGSPQNKKRKRLSEAILTLQNSCQELDDICCMNNWALPSYSVLPSNGEFHANVMLQGMDFDLSCAGDPRTDPREARESAAAQLLIKLRSMAGQSKA